VDTARLLAVYSRVDGGWHCQSESSIGDTLVDLCLNSIETWRTCFLFLLENSVMKEENNLFALIIKMEILFTCNVITSTALASSVLLLSFSINVLAFYHECCSLIGYGTHYLFCDIQ